MIGHLGVPKLQHRVPTLDQLATCSTTVTTRVEPLAETRELSNKPHSSTPRKANLTCRTMLAATPPTTTCITSSTMGVWAAALTRYCRPSRRRLSSPRPIQTRLTWRIICISEMLVAATRAMVAPITSTLPRPSKHRRPALTQRWLASSRTPGTSSRS